MSLSMTSGACLTVQAARARLERLSRELRAGSLPTNRKRAAGWRSAAYSRPCTTISGALSPPMASTARVKAQVAGNGEACRAPASDADSAPQRLAGCDDFAPIIMATMAAHVVRPLQLPAIGAFGVRLVRQG